MNVSPKCLDLIQSFEGLKLEAYKCPAGVWTCGIGATGPGICEGVVWTPQQARDRLNKDLAERAARVKALVKVALSQGEFDALVSLVFNIGLGAFAGSTLLKLLNQGLRAQAADEFLKWDKIAGKDSSGLLRRRAAERHLFLSN